MGDGIGFEESRAGLIPLVGFYGNLFSEKRSWLCGRAAPLFCEYGQGLTFCQWWQLRWQGGLGGGYVAEELTISWEPQGQDDLQPF